MDGMTVMHPLPAGMQMIPRALIYSDDQNVRVVKASSAEDKALIQSIQSVGLLQPLVVTWVEGTPPYLDGYKVLAGNRRLAACEAAELDPVPCVVREVGTAGAETLIQLSENLVRQDMAAVDVFVAFERLALEGMDDDSIAFALNRTKRTVLQMRAVGRLHPKIVQYVRETGAMPGDRDLRIICQAPEEMQGKAFEEARKKAGKQPVPWWMVSRDCTIDRIPMRFARFDPALYTGPIYADLFAEPPKEGEQDNREADDPKLFLKLQQDWVDAEILKMREAGFTAMVGPTTEHGDTKAPPGCVISSWYLLQKKLPPKKERAGLVYTARVKVTGEVEERLWPLQKIKEPDKKKGAAAKPGTPSEKTSSNQTRDEPGVWLTKDGADKVERAKRTQISGAVGMAFGAADLLAVAVLLLADKYSHGRTYAMRLFAEDGRLDLDSEDRYEKIKTSAALVLAELIQAGGVGTNAAVPMGLVERIGAGLHCEPVYVVTRDDLDDLKRPALEAIQKARRVPGFNTQKETKNAIVRLCEAKELQAKGSPAKVILSKADLPLLACKPAAELPYGWPKIKVVDGQPKVVQDESGCAKADGTDACDCGWKRGGDAECDAGFVSAEDEAKEKAAAEGEGAPA